MKNKRHYFIGIIGFIFLLASTGLAQGQEEAETNLLQYIADYEILWQDLPEWTEIHHTQTAPVLDSLVEAGIIAGWSVWQHHTGGRYNWRMIINAEQWDDFEAFWDSLFASFSEETVEQTGPMVRAHRDQIWEQSEVHISDAAASIPWAYESLFQIKFSDLEGWKKNWEEVAVPLMKQAMKDGHLAGWVADDHNTGDQFNRAQVYLFEDWDDIDNFFNTVVGGLMSDSATWDRIGGMIQGHEDTIWRRVTKENGN